MNYGEAAGLCILAVAAGFCSKPSDYIKITIGLIAGVLIGASK